MGRKEDLLIQIRLKLSHCGFSIEQIGHETKGFRRKTVAQLQAILNRLWTESEAPK